MFFSSKLNVYDKSMIAKYVYKALENQRAIKINYETDDWDTLFMGWEDKFWY